MFDYQQTNSFFAQIADGLEDPGYDELSVVVQFKLMFYYNVFN